MTTFARPAAILIALCIGLAATNARADIYGYIDSDGVGHFSTEKLDARYQLFMKGNNEFDSSALGAAVPPGKGPLFQYLSHHPNLKKYESLLSQAAKDYSIDPALLKAVMAAESGFNPSAVSPKGAVGLMQVMPATAERYGLQSDKKYSVSQKLTDPKTNIRLGARYLRDLHRMFPAQPNLVLASYNAGEGAVQKYKNKVPPYPETINYVQIVSQFYRLYQRGLDKTGVRISRSPSSPNRIIMTIPGRRNLPSAPSTIPSTPETQ